MYYDLKSTKEKEMYRNVSNTKYENIWGNLSPVKFTGTCAVSAKKAVRGTNILVLNCISSH